jgi:hypothetical protein
VSPGGFYPGAPEGLVLAKLRALGYTVAEVSVASYWCDKGGGGFFITKPPDGITYSAEQLSEIDKALAYFGEDLLPLDANL